MSDVAKTKAKQESEPEEEIKIDIANLRINFESKVLSSEKVILIPHKVADLDAIGSTIGLSLAVKQLERVPIIIVDDKQYELGTEIKDIIKAEKDNIQILNRSKYMAQSSGKDFFVMSDVNKAYMTAIPEMLNDPERVMIIDHHDPDSKTVDSNYKYIDPILSTSASEIVTKLLIEMGITIPPNVANYLLAGIYLDSVNLTKGTVSEDTYDICKALKKFGADLNVVMEMFSEDPESDRKLSELVNRTKIITYKIALIIASNQEEYSTQELAKAADRGLKYGVDASISVGQLSDEVVGASARSKGKFHVGEIMSEISEGHGGGHSTSGAAQMKETSIEEVSKKLELTLRPNHYYEPSENKK